jgi:hypothetical protein
MQHGTLPHKLKVPLKPLHCQPRSPQNIGSKFTPVKAFYIEKSYESCFWILWGTISEESKNKVKILAGTRWMELQTSCDTQLLFQLITESHHTKAFGDGDVNALLNASALEAQMQSLKQDDSSLSQFAHINNNV